MNAEKISVKLRPRNAWESISLGLLFAQRHWGDVILPWSLLAGFTFALLMALFPSEEYGVAMLIFWWLKPVYDRFLLHLYSSALFGAKLTTAEALRSLPRVLLNSGLLLSLTLLRLSPRRSYVLPVWQLEQLKGHARGERIRILRYPNTTYPLWLTLACSNFEWVITLGLLGLLYLFTPAGAEPNLFGLLQDPSGLIWLDWLSNIAYVLAVLLIEPLYVAAGFMLYLNRRTHLECWDIELIFRSMARRLHQALKSGAVAGLLITAVILQPEPASASPATTDGHRSLAEASQRIEQVLAREEFGKQDTTTIWVPRIKDSYPQDDTSLPEWLDRIKTLGHYAAETFRAALWVLVALLAVLLFLYRNSWMGWRPGKRHSQASKDVPEDLDEQPNDSLASSLDTATPLPDDIPHTALGLTMEGKYRPALSLLYRGTLQQLQQQSPEQLSAGATEADILQLARSTLPAEQFDYLHDITNTWQRIAWGHQDPMQKEVIALCQQWLLHYPTSPAEGGA